MFHKKHSKTTISNAKRKIDFLGGGLNYRILFQTTRRICEKKF